jgi:CheY-like chemotaxis protein
METISNNNDANELSGKRIFLVEDDVINLHVLSKPLSSWGAIIFSNYNAIGIELHILENLPIDLILLDLMLRGGASGYETFRNLQLNPRTARIPVIAITSLDPATEIPKALAFGFAGFISKPINVLTYARDIVEILHGKNKWVVSR